MALVAAGDAEGSGDVDAAPRACLLLVCGLPGSGKSTFCKALLERAAKDPRLFGELAEWHHICYDDVEAELRNPAGDFDPSAWQAARDRCAQLVEDVLAPQGADTIQSASRRVLLLDDNMYYRSMRKQWYHFAREHGCVYRQVFLRAPQEVCLERNQSREPARRVPSFSVVHMAEVFQWPRESGDTWEAQPSVTTVLDAEALSTEEQLASFLAAWPAPDRAFWGPPPATEELGAPETQSDGHACDLALRKIVAQAIANVPKELGPAKSTLAKKWGVRKAELVRHFNASLKAEAAAEAPAASDLVQEMEAVFLRSCVADVQQLLQGR